MQNDVWASDIEFDICSYEHIACAGGVLDLAFPAASSKTSEPFVAAVLVCELDEGFSGDFEENAAAFTRAGLAYARFICSAKDERAGVCLKDAANTVCELAGARLEKDVLLFLAGEGQGAALCARLGLAWSKVRGVACWNLLAERAALEKETGFANAGCRQGDSAYEQLLKKTVSVALNDYLSVTRFPQPVVCHWLDGEILLCDSPRSYVDALNQPERWLVSDLLADVATVERIEGYLRIAVRKSCQADSFMDGCELEAHGTSAPFWRVRSTAAYGSGTLTQSMELAEMLERQPWVDDCDFAVIWDSNVLCPEHNNGNPMQSLATWVLTHM